MEQMQLIWFKCEWQRNSLLFNADALLLVCTMRLLSKPLDGFIWRLQEEAFSTQRHSLFYLNPEHPTPPWVKPTPPPIPLYISKIWSPLDAPAWLPTQEPPPSGTPIIEVSNTNCWNYSSVEPWALKHAPPRQEEPLLRQTLLHPRTYGI